MSLFPNACGDGSVQCPASPQARTERMCGHVDSASPFRSGMRLAGEGQRLCAMVRGVMRHAVSRSRAAHVVGLRSKTQVIWVTTRRIVTCVQNAGVVRPCHRMAP